MRESALPGLLDRQGVLGAHLIEGERTASGTETAEKRLRSGGTEFVDWVILVGGYDSEALAKVGANVLSEGNLAAQGAAASRIRGIYRFVHCVSKADLPVGSAAASRI